MKKEKIVKFIKDLIYQEIDKLLLKYQNILLIPIINNKNLHKNKN